MSYFRYVRLFMEAVGWLGFSMSVALTAWGVFHTVKELAADAHRMLKIRAAKLDRRRHG